jgi:hypothetical protein
LHGQRGERDAAGRQQALHVCQAVVEVKVGLDEHADGARLLLGAGAGVLRAVGIAVLLVRPLQRGLRKAERLIHHASLQGVLCGPHGVLCVLLGRRWLPHAAPKRCAAAADAGGSALCVCCPQEQWFGSSHVPHSDDG